jgi:enolase
MDEIAKLEALEILDARGNLTSAVTATLTNGVKAPENVADLAVACGMRQIKTGSGI